MGGRWNVLNLGAILFARDIGEFDSRLARKAIRIVVYDGDGRAATVTHRMDMSLGYASGFRGLNAHINTLVPSPEDLGTGVRKEKPLFPRVAIRELMANALIHQDMTITGAGPTVELFRNRLEIINPGAPLVVPERFIDAPPRSRNEALASLMRRMGLCEEQGTGIDKVVAAVEEAQLPPPEFRAEAGATCTTLFGPRRFADMTTEERLRGCYQHAVLRYLSEESHEERHLARALRGGRPKRRPDLASHPPSPRRASDSKRGSGRARGPGTYRSGRETPVRAGFDRDLIRGPHRGAPKVEFSLKTTTKQ